MDPIIILLTILNTVLIITVITIIYKLIKRFAAKQTKMDNISSKLDNLEKEVNKINISNNDKK